MKKTYKGTNSEPVKICGVPFKAGEIVSIEVIDEPYTHSWCDPFEGIVHERKTQIQQINVHATDKRNDATIALWGYDHSGSRDYINWEKGKFKAAVTDCLSKIGIK